VGNIIPIAEMRKLYLGKSQLACSLLSVEKWCKRSLGFAEAHKPLEGRSHVWVIFVSPVTGWTCDSVKGCRGRRRGTCEDPTAQR